MLIVLASLLMKPFLLIQIHLCNISTLLAINPSMTELIAQRVERVRFTVDPHLTVLPAVLVPQFQALMFLVELSPVHLVTLVEPFLVHLVTLVEVSPMHLVTLVELSPVHLVTLVELSPVHLVTQVYLLLMRLTLRELPVPLVDSSGVKPLEIISILLMLVSVTNTNLYVLY
jgi:hypothetical protein